MKIISIFVGKLYSFSYPSKDGKAAQHEFKRLLNAWTDTEFLYKFLESNKNDLPKGETVASMLVQIKNYANDLNDELIDCALHEERKLSHFFAPLRNTEFYEVVLSKQKGKKRFLRLYAIRIDRECFVITGGAIKLTRFMEERPHTNAELLKMDKCREYLKSNGVLDGSSFQDYLKEEL